MAVQAPAEVADWHGLEVPSPEAEVPDELVERELDALRASAAELIPVEDRPAKEGDVLVADLVDETGETQRDYVIQLGAGRLVEEIERGLRGMSAGETRTISYPLAGRDARRRRRRRVKEIKEPVLPPLDDDLARATSEFETLAELRTELESRLREAIDAELESEFRAAAVDKLVEASKVDISDSLVEARAAELLSALLRSLERRGVNAETYLRITDQTAEQLREKVPRGGPRGDRARARPRGRRRQARDRGLRRRGARPAPRAGRGSRRGCREADRGALAERPPRRLREDLRLKQALDQIVEDVTPIPVELARARDSIWTPEKEKPETPTKLWTPGSKEPA